VIVTPFLAASLVETVQVGHSFVPYLEGMCLVFSKSEDEDDDSLNHI